MDREQLRRDAGLFPDVFLRLMARLVLFTLSSVLVAACANLLDYDEVSFTDDAALGGGAAGGGAGGSTAGGAGGADSSAGGGAAGNPSGGAAGVATGGVGGAAAGGTGGVTTGGTGGVTSGGTGGVATGGTGGVATGGTGGVATGGTGGVATGGTGGSSTGGATGSHYETKTETGATGNEPGGIIPVCCVPSATEKAGIDEVFKLLNQHRLANGKSALAYDLKLEAAIVGHCHHMVTHPFSAHDAPEAVVGTPWTRATLCGAGTTNYHGENIYWGSSTPTAPMDWWKGSPGHNANMLSGNFTRVGIGNYGTRWGQLFGS